MHDEDVISTMAEGGDTKLRITMYNTYPKKTVMANCARLVSSDHFSSNGVVHMVDRVIQPARHTIGKVCNLHAVHEELLFAVPLEADKLLHLFDTLGLCVDHAGTDGVGQ